MSFPLSRAAIRAGGALGLAHVAVTLAGFAIVGPSEDTILGAQAGDVVRFYTEADSTKVFTGGYVELLGYLLFLPFAVILTRHLAAASSSASVAAGTARLAAGVYVALVMVGFAAGGAALYAAQRGGVDMVFGLNLVRTFTYVTALAALGVFLIAVATAGMAGRTLPKGLTISAAVLGATVIAGIAGAADGLHDIPGFLSMFWLLPVSIWLLRQRTAVDARQTDARISVNA